MPRPSKGESENDFVSRCVPIVIDEGTAEDGAQAAAICHSIYRESKANVEVHHLRVQFSGAVAIRRELFNGKMHTVVPAVLAVEGVLNEALVTADELGKFAEAWNGRPIPIAHPQENGKYISANFPDILERTAGTVFGAHMDGDSLKAEFWLDEQRMDSLGFAPLLAAMREGEMIELSTAYFADDLLTHGEFKGKPYNRKHVNIRPDHVALLPGDTGACSIADGCGAPRVNDERKPIANALSTLMRALGLKPNDCNCQEPPTMSNVKTLAAGLVAMIAMLPADQQAEIKANIDTAELEKMSEKQLAGLSAWIKAIQKNYGADGKKKEEEEAVMKAQAKAKAEADAAAAASQEPLTLGKLQTMITSAVTTALSGDAINAAVRRASLKSEVLANKACAFGAAELDAMSVETLDKYAASIRPVDYSGAAGFHAAAHRGAETEIEEPFGGGALSRIKAAAAKAQ